MKAEAGSGKLEAGSWKLEAGSGKPEAGGSMSTNTITPRATHCLSRAPLRFITAPFTVVVAALIAMPVVSADRLPDKDVKALIERIDHERDRFEDQLDGKLKRTILRGAGGETHVERYLDDLQENVDKLKERFTPEYAASAEVTTVLRQGSDIQRFMSTQPADLDGASEWNRLAGSLRELAAIYGTTLPIAEGQQARRFNDREVAKAADDLSKSADRFKNGLDSSLKNDKTIDKATREAAVKEADALKQGAKRLASLVGDGRPASGEAKALLDHVSKIKGASAGRTLSPAAQTAWRSVETSLDKVAQAFSLPGQLP
jgi:hypothetical protein